jgi:aminomethyltransferase
LRKQPHRKENALAHSDELLRTPLHEAHLAGKARMVDFAGWAMPLLYTSILDEHAKCRADAVAFDVSHMGRLRVTGGGAYKLLDKVCSADIVTQEDNTARYSLLCNQRGGVIDDTFILRLEGEWMVVCNASNRLKVVEHIQSVNAAAGYGANIEDTTGDSAMIAVQGPKALARLAELLPFDVGAVGRHELLTGDLMGVRYIASRTGYTGEVGFEIILPASAGAQAWDALTSSGFAPAGLGSRDVLRLEAALPLYGHELNEMIDPVTAGLGRAARKEGDYVGAAAIAEVRRKGAPRKLVGVRVGSPRIARQGVVVYADGWEVGAVTSGTFSPSCDASIALAYVDRQFAGIGQELVVRIKPTEEVPGLVVEKPFYRGSAFRAL